MSRGYRFEPESNDGYHPYSNRPDDRKPLRKVGETVDYEVPKIKLHVRLPDAVVLGKAQFAGEKLPLNLVEFSMEENNFAYALMTDNEIDGTFPNRVYCGGNVLSHEYQRGSKSRNITTKTRLLGVAYRSPYGLCKMPPHWELLEAHLDILDLEAKARAMYSAVVLVGWEDGNVSWQVANETIRNASDQNDWAGYLADLGRKNEANFNLLIKQHYLRTVDHDRSLAADVKGSPWWPECNRWKSIKDRKNILSS
jgi:hypothetical protein